MEPPDARDLQTRLTDIQDLLNQLLRFRVPNKESQELSLKLRRELAAARELEAASRLGRPPE